MTRKYQAKPNNVTKRSCYECGIEAKNLKLIEIDTQHGKRLVYLCSSCQRQYSLKK
jgi:predicted SprT family Zn-dependent metalloprotease